MIIVTSLHRDFLPSSWGMYRGTICDWSTFLGTIGLFLTLFFLFIRFLPTISIFEMRTHPARGRGRGGEAVRPAATHLRPDGRVPRAGRGGGGRARACTPPATARSTPTRPTRSRSCSRRSHLHATRTLPKLVLAGRHRRACVGGYGLQYWASVIEYPMNIGGRPFHSWPAFIVPTFETTILFAALAAVLGMLALNGLPSPTTRCSTCRASRSPAATASSSASRRATRSSTARRRASFLRRPGGPTWPRCIRGRQP